MNGEKKSCDEAALYVEDALDPGAVVGAGDGFLFSGDVREHGHHEGFLGDQIVERVLLMVRYQKIVRRVAEGSINRAWSTIWSLRRPP